MAEWKGCRAPILRLFIASWVPNPTGSSITGCCDAGALIQPLYMHTISFDCKPPWSPQILQSLEPFRQLIILIDLLLWFRRRRSGLFRGIIQFERSRGGRGFVLPRWRDR